MNVIRVALIFMFAFISTVNAQHAKRLKTEKTLGHVIVPGTGLYLEIPEGFNRALTCVGWNNPEGSYVVVRKIPKSLTEACEDLEKELLNMGYNINADRKKRILLNDEDAVYFQTNNGTLEKHFLLIKAKEFTYVVEGYSFEKVNETKAMKKAVLSAFVEN